MRLSHGTQQSGRAIAVTERARIRPKITSNWPAPEVGQTARRFTNRRMGRRDDCNDLQARRLFLYKNNLQMRSGLESRRLGESLPAPAARLASTSFLRSFCNFLITKGAATIDPTTRTILNPQWSRRGRCDEWNEAE